MCVSGFDARKSGERWRDCFSFLLFLFLFLLRSPFFLSFFFVFLSFFLALHLRGGLETLLRERERDQKETKFSKSCARERVSFSIFFLGGEFFWECGCA